MNQAVERERVPSPDGPRLCQAVVSRLIAGDDEAWRRFLTDYLPVFAKVVRAAARQIGMSLSPSKGVDVADVVCDAQAYFYAAFRRSFERFDGEGRFRAFLFRTTRNFLLEQGRRSREAAKQDHVVDFESVAAGRWRPEAEASLDDRVRALDYCLLRLAPSVRALVYLHYFGEPPRSLSALAAELGISADAAHKRFQRALAALRECLAAGRPARDAR